MDSFGYHEAAGGMRDRPARVHPDDLAKVDGGLQLSPEEAKALRSFLLVSYGGNGLEREWTPALSALDDERGWSADADLAAKLVVARIAVAAAFAEIELGQKAKRRRFPRIRIVTPAGLPLALLENALVMYSKHLDRKWQREQLPLVETALGRLDYVAGQVWRGLGLDWPQLQGS
jgi:hypothetical protein